MAVGLRRVSRRLRHFPHTHVDVIEERRWRSADKKKPGHEARLSFVGTGPTITFQRGTAGCTTAANLGGCRNRLPTAHANYEPRSCIAQHDTSHASHAGSARESRTQLPVAKW